MSREENVSFVETICIEAPKSMMKLGELDVPTIKVHALSLSSEFDPPSFFFEKSGREMLFCSRSWVNPVNFLLHTRSLRMIALNDVCPLAHFYFILLLFGVLLGSLRLLLIL